MTQVLRFKLKKGLRNPVDVDAGSSNFCGREPDIRRLTHLILNRDSASVLVSGVRGVGKTSFVREALRRITIDKGKKLKTVYISLADVNFEEEEKLRLKVLKTLIRSLYFACDDKERELAELDSLYDKTYLMEITENELTEFIDTKKDEDRSLKVSEQKITFSFSEGALEIVRIGAASLLTAGGLALGAMNQIIYTILALCSIVVAVLIVLKVNLSFLNRGEDEKKKTVEATKKTQKSGIARLDLSADTLEHQFEQALKILSKEGKIVFILDELDKLAVIDSEDIHEHGVYQVIKPLKNIFNLSKSIFIFVGADDFYDKLEEQKRTSPYAGAHTIFTDKIFLTGMYYEEIRQLIDNQKDGDLIVGDEEKYEQFTAYVAWQARNHVFDTYSLLEEFTEYTADDEAYISVTEDDSDHKGGVAEDWGAASGLQLYMNAAFSYYKDIARSRLRERFYLTMREVGQKLFDESEITVTDNQYLQILSDGTQNLLKISSSDLSEPERLDLEGAVEDFLARTTRTTDRDFITVSETVETEDPEDETESTRHVSVKKYVFSDIGFPYEARLRTSNDPLSFEEDFVSALNLLKQVRRNLEQPTSTVLVQHQKTFKRMERVAYRITNKERNREPKSVIIELQKELESLVDNLHTAVFQELSVKVAQALGGISSNKDSNVIERLKSVSPAGVEKFISQIQDEISEEYYAVIEYSGKYALLFLNATEEEQQLYISVSRSDKTKAPLRCLNIIFDESIKNKKKQFRWMTASGKPDFEDLTVLRRKVKETLAR